MSLEVIRRISPDEEELATRREELARQEVQLVEQEFALVSLKADLAAFNGLYLRSIGVLYAELDEWNARLAERRADIAATSEAHAAAAEARVRADQSHSEVHCEAAQVQSFVPSEELNTLYREALLCVHPDTATDAADRTRRERFLTEVNAAYAACDESALQNIIAARKANPETVPRYGIGADLIRIQLQLSQIRTRIMAIKQEMTLLGASEIARLRQDAERAQRESRDLLAEMESTIRNQIEKAKKDFDDLGRQIAPVKPSLIMRGRRDAIDLTAQISPRAAPLTSQSLRTLIGRIIFVIHCADQDNENGYTLLHLKNGSVVMAATDGRRYSVVQKTDEVIEIEGGEKRVLIPCAILRELQLLEISEVATVELIEEEGSFGLRVGTRIFTWDKLTHQIPDYEAAILQDYECSVVVRASDLSGAIRRAIQFAYSNGRGIQIQLRQDKLTISSTDTCFGEGEETLEVSYSGQEIAGGFDSGHLLDFLDAFGDTGEIRLELKDSNSVCQIRPEGKDIGYHWRYLVMPLRIRCNHGELPTEFSVSFPATTLQSLIDDIDFDDLFGRYKPSMLLLKPDAVAVVTRAGHRLSVAQVATNLLEGVGQEMRIMVPREIMRSLQLLPSAFDGERVELAQSKDGYRFRVGHHYLGWLDRREQSPDDLVALPPADYSVALPADTVNKLIEGTAFAVGDRWNVEFALLRLEPDSLSLVATDGYRLASMEKINERIIGIFGEQRIVIPRDILLELVQVLKTSSIKNLELAENAQACSLRLGSHVLNWVKPADMFPDFEFVTERRRTNHLSAGARDLSAAIRRLHQQCGWREMPILLKLRNGEVGISWDNAKANGSEEIIPARYSGEPLTVGFQANFMLEFLNAIASPVEIRLEFEDAQSAWELSPADLPVDYRWRYFVMPRKSNKTPNLENS